MGGGGGGLGAGKVFCLLYPQDWIFRWMIVQCCCRVFHLCISWSCNSTRGAQHKSELAGLTRDFGC